MFIWNGPILVTSIKLEYMIYLLTAIGLKPSVYMGYAVVSAVLVLSVALFCDTIFFFFCFLTKSVHL